MIQWQSTAGKGIWLPPEERIGPDFVVDRGFLINFFWHLLSRLVTMISAASPIGGCYYPSTSQAPEPVSTPPLLALTKDAVVGLRFGLNHENSTTSAIWGGSLAATILILRPALKSLGFRGRTFGPSRASSLVVLVTTRGENQYRRWPKISGLRLCPLPAKWLGPKGPLLGRCWRRSVGRRAGHLAAGLGSRYWKRQPDGLGQCEGHGRHRRDSQRGGGRGRGRSRLPQDPRGKVDLMFVNDGTKPHVSHGPKVSATDP